MIDWSNVVLGPCMDQFAIPMYFAPKTGAPFWARGVWETTPYTIVQENEAPLVTTVFKIGLRLSEFTVQPVQGDAVTIDGETFLLDSYEYDGQGGVRWVVKAKAAKQETHGGVTPT